MPDIYHTLSIAGSKERIFEAIGTAEGLNSWWTLTARGVPRSGAIYDFGFGPDFQWQAEVIRCEPGGRAGMENDQIRCRLGWERASGFNSRPSAMLHRLTSIIRDGSKGVTTIGFPHFAGGCTSGLLRRYIERGEVVPYDMSAVRHRHLDKNYLFRTQQPETCIDDI